MIKKGMICLCGIGFCLSLAACSAKPAPQPVISQENLAALADGSGSQAPVEEDFSVPIEYNYTFIPIAIEDSETEVLEEKMPEWYVENEEIVTLEEPVENDTFKEPSLMGAEFAGIFAISSVNVGVKCYYSTQQVICDAPDAACLFKVQQHWVIADHNYQGFDKIKGCQVGDVAYGPDNRVYRCTSVIKGVNTGSLLTTTDGTRIDNMYPGSLVAYTCNDNWQDVTIVFFEPCEGENDVLSAIQDVGETINMDAETITEIVTKGLSSLYQLYMQE